MLFGLTNHQLGDWITYVLITLTKPGTLYQMYLNWKNKSAKMMSAYDTLFYLFQICMRTLYVFLLWMPFSQRFAILIGLSSPMVFAYQKYWYSDNDEDTAIMFYGMVFIYVFSAFLYFLGQWYPSIIGHTLGWLGFAFALAKGGPQIMHNYQRKSVKGFTIFYLANGVIVYSANILVAFLLKLPIQTTIRNIYQTTVNTILLGQFLYYSEKENAPKK